MCIYFAFTKLRKPSGNHSGCHTFDKDLSCPSDPSHAFVHQRGGGKRFRFNECSCHFQLITNFIKPSPLHPPIKTASCLKSSVEFISNFNDLKAHRHPNRIILVFKSSHLSPRTRLGRLDANVSSSVLASLASLTQWWR